MQYMSLDKVYLKKVFDEDGLSETGLSLNELEQGVRKLTDGKEWVSPFSEKGEAFRFILKNVRFSVSTKDLFPSLNIWGRYSVKDIWVEKNRITVISSLIPAEHRKRIEEFSQKHEASFVFDFAHSVPDWDVILSLGFPGLLSRCRLAEEQYLAGKYGPITEEKKLFYAEVRQAYEAVMELMSRLTKVASKKSCRPETIAVLMSLQSGPAVDFYGALMQIWLYYQISEYADGIQTRSFGNLDQILYPYYKADIASGKCTVASVRLILANFMYKIASMNYKYGHPFYLGGTLPDGCSAVNDLSRIILDVYREIGVFDPKLQIKVAENTPVDFLDQALNLIRTGRNSLVFIGEPCVKRTMLKIGYSEEQARQAVIKGCYEYCVNGEAVETAPIEINLPSRVVHYLKAHTDAGSFEEFYRGCLDDIKAICLDLMDTANILETYIEFVNPSLMVSAVCENSLKNGVDAYSKGIRYQNSNVWLIAPASAVNALRMIQKYVFEYKEITLPELAAALDANWKGCKKYEQLQRRIRNAEDAFGNGKSKTDALAKNFLEGIAKNINGKPNNRGGFYTTALHGADKFFYWGTKTEATADGRYDGEELSKNISPQSGTAFNGVTALIRSVLTLDTSLFMGDFPLDVMLLPQTVAGGDGLAALRNLVLTWVKNFGHAIHFNVFSSKILRDAMANPDHYADLQVRICGWNALWSSLSQKEQSAYLLQAEACEKNEATA